MGRRVKDPSASIEGRERSRAGARSVDARVARLRGGLRGRWRGGPDVRPPVGPVVALARAGRAARPQHLPRGRAGLRRRRRPPRPVHRGHVPRAPRGVARLPPLRSRPARAGPERGGSRCGGRPLPHPGASDRPRGRGRPRVPRAGRRHRGAHREHVRREPTCDLHDPPARAPLDPDDPRRGGALGPGGLSARGLGLDGNGPAPLRAASGADRGARDPPLPRPRPPRRVRPRRPLARGGARGGGVRRRARPRRDLDPDAGLGELRLRGRVSVDPPPHRPLASLDRADTASVERRRRLRARHRVRGGPQSGRDRLVDARPPGGRRGGGRRKVVRERPGVVRPVRSRGRRGRRSRGPVVVGGGARPGPYRLRRDGPRDRDPRSRRAHRAADRGVRRPVPVWPHLPGALPVLPAPR